MVARIFDVTADTDGFRQAAYPERESHPEWAAIDNLIAKVEPIDDRWRPISIPSLGSSKRLGDFFEFRMGTLAIRQSADDRVKFRERFKGRAEFLPFRTDGEPCFLLHFTGKHDALDYNASPHRFISNGALIADSGGAERFRSDFETDDWLFRIVGTICIYTIDSGPGSFFDIYHNEQMTGLEFEERRFSR